MAKPTEVEKKIIPKSEKQVVTAECKNIQMKQGDMELLGKDCIGSVVTTASIQYKDEKTGHIIKTKSDVPISTPEFPAKTFVDEQITVGNCSKHPLKWDGRTNTYTNPRKTYDVSPTKCTVNIGGNPLPEKAFVEIQDGKCVGNIEKQQDVAYYMNEKNSEYLKLREKEQKIDEKKQAGEEVRELSKTEKVKLAGTLKRDFEELSEELKRRAEYSKNSGCGSNLRPPAWKTK